MGTSPTVIDKYVVAPGPGGRLGCRLLDGYDAAVAKEGTG